MISDINSGIHSKVIEIFENERYSPLSGWSKNSLIPTDRKAFSSRDGQASWNSLAEASDNLISIGWKWEEDSDWILDSQNPDVDSEGWSYSTDFKSYSQYQELSNDVSIIKDYGGGSGIKSMMHFVRRRRYTRHQTFDVNLIAETKDLTCDHCDIEEVSNLSQLFLEILVRASLTKHPRYIDAFKINQLKNQLIKYLRIEEKKDLESHIDSDANKEKLSNSMLSLDIRSGPSQYSYDQILQNLNRLVEECKSMLSSASSLLQSTASNEETAHKRMTEILNYYYTTEERKEIALLLIRKTDLENSYHCIKRNCGPSCIFAPETCPNIGCNHIYSRKWHQRHDLECPHKLMECERKCGRSVKRKFMATHLEEECSLRPVKCPFYEFGCESELIDKDLKDHLNNCQSDHLNFALIRMKEYQSIIIELNNKVNDLETKSNDHKSQLASLAAGVAGAMTAIKVSETRSNKATQNEISKLDRKLSKNINNVQSNLTAELNKLKKESESSAK